MAKIEISNEYESLVKDIQKYNPLYLIQEAIKWAEDLSRFDYCSPAYAQNLRSSPSYIELDLIIRLVHFHGKEPLYGKRKINEYQFIELCRKLRALKNRAEVNVIQNNSPGSEQWLLPEIMGRGAFQQFRYQNQRPIESLARQYIIFVECDENNILNEKFKKIGNIDIAEFLCIFTIFLMLMDKYGCAITFTKGKSNALQKIFTDEVVKKFFNLLSSEISEAKEFIKNYKTYEDINFQLLAPTPFERYPFFKDQGKDQDYYIPYHKLLLNTAAVNNLYDICKGIDPNLSASYNAKKPEGGFGKIFENYIYNYCLEYYEHEKQKNPRIFDIQKDSGFKKDKHADFLLLEDNSAVLIECKSTEYSKSSRTIQSKDQQIKALEGVKKGTMQIIKTVDQLIQTQKQKEAIEKVASFFGIVVTYKQHYVGYSPNNFPEEKKKALEFTEDNPRIPYKNIFYLSIEEFDCLIGAATETKLTIGEILSRIAGDAGGSLTFLQKLGILFNGRRYYPKYLQSTIDKMTLTLIKNRLF